MRPAAAGGGGGRGGAGFGMAAQDRFADRVEAQAQAGQMQRGTSGPLVAKTARMQLVVVDLDAARTRLERELNARGGSLTQLHVSGERPAPRTLTATVSVPPAQLDAALSTLRSFGRVEDESQSSEDVTSQSIDLDARLTNARRTEQRLATIIRERTGRLSDVLEVERESTRVRTDVERMEAERKRLDARVAMAAIELTISEERSAEVALAGPPIRRVLINAFRDGVRGAGDLALSVVVLALRVGPTLLLCALLFSVPAALVTQRRRKRIA